MKRMGLLFLAALSVTAAGEPPPQTMMMGTPILGRALIDSAGVSVGRVIDVLVGSDGRPAAVLVDVGGFMGVGTRRVAVAWDTLRFPPPGLDKPLTVVLSADTMRSAPAATGMDHPVPVMMAPVGPP